MKMKEPKQILKGVSYAYLAMAILGTILAVATAAVPQVASKLTEITGNEFAIVAFEILIAIGVLSDLWNFWLGKRVVDGKSRGTFYLILLVITAIGNIITMITNPSQLFKSVDCVLDIIALVCLIKIRKEN